ncbi:MAG: mandelate racemase/muconate lactonizing enzyme family protein [Bacteroidota bacterium]
MPKTNTIQRRKFLQSLAVGAIAAPLATPAQAAAEPSEWPKETPSGIKITKVTPIAVPYAIYVKVETDAGITGWGEADKDFRPLGVKVINDVLKKHVEGKDALATDAIWNEMFFRSHDEGTHGMLSGAIAGIDNALWDLKGKILGLPVYKLLGGAFRKKIKVYGSFGVNMKSHEREKYGNADKKSPAQMAEIATNFAEQGYTAIKVRMQIRQLNIDPNPDPSFATVKAVREAVGDDMIIFFDANNGYTPHRAIEVVKELRERYNIASIEEPVTMNNYHALAQVSEAVDVPVAVGEHEYTRWHFRDLITVGKADILNPDLIKAGGMSECRKIAAVAQAFDKPVMVHNAYPMIGTAASMHFAASVPNAAEYQEYVGPRLWQGLQKYFKNDIKFEDGHLYLPEGPGWGLEMDEEALMKDRIN